MRLAILADIHANIWALEAVLAHARSHSVDAFINLGDTLYGPLKPRETYDRLLQENIAITIQGNQDRLIYEASARDLVSIPTLTYVIRELGEEPIHWLNDLPKTAVFDNDIFLCHGTPGSDTAYLLEDIMTCSAVSAEALLSGMTHFTLPARISSCAMRQGLREGVSITGGAPPCNCRARRAATRMYR